MEKNTRENYQVAIDLGKKKMRSSKDPYHDFIHAQNVESVSLQVYEELKDKDYKDIETITPEQIRVTAWWHDCYKANQDEFSVTGNFYEGEGSAIIMRKELASLIPPDELDEMIVAVRNHAGSKLFTYFFLNRPQSVLHKILIEADAHELINSDRAKRGCQQKISLKHKLWIIIDLFEPFMLPLYLRTDTTRKDLTRRIWNYWATWLWRDKIYFKLFLK